MKYFFCFFVLRPNVYKIGNQVTKIELIDGLLKKHGFGIALTLIFKRQLRPFDVMQ
jgi:hypothetical protein